MKTLIFLRHAKSSWADLGQQDKDRPLNPRGNRDAPIMARRLMDLYPAIDLVMSSSSQRTRETVSHFAAAFTDKWPVTTYHDSLYHGTATDYESVLSILDDSLSTILLVGHNPGITEIANDCQHDEFISNVATCGIVILTSKCRQWTDIDLTMCYRDLYIYPKLYA